MSSKNKKIARKQKESESGAHYQNLLKQMDLMVDSRIEELENQDAMAQEENEMNLRPNINRSLKANEGLAEKEDQEDNFLSLSDLLNVAEKEKISTDTIKQHLVYLNRQDGKVKEPEALHKEEEAERRTNYTHIKKDLKKWESIVNRNRNADFLDFTDKQPRDVKRINAVNEKLGKNEIVAKLEQKLKQHEVANEQQIKKQETDLLRKLQPKEAKEKIKEIQKNKSLMFYQELKNKRIARIKSKLYHKIKNKREKENNDRIMKNIEELDPAFRKNELEKMRMKRAEERISLKHRIKSKYTKNLLRYGGDKKAIQNSINELDRQRKDLLKKIVVDDDEFSQEDAEFDNENFREKAILDLEKELREEAGNSQTKSKTGLKFIDRFVEKKDKEAREEAEKLLRMLRENPDFDGIELSEGDKASEEGEKADLKEKSAGEKRKNETDLQPFTGRKQFKKDEPIEIENGRNDKGFLNREEKEVLEEKKRKSQTVTSIINSYLKDAEEQEDDKLGTNIPAKNGSSSLTELINEKKFLSQQNSNKQGSQTGTKGDGREDREEKISVHINEENLTSGINIASLQERYNKQGKNIKFTAEDFERFKGENQDEIYKDLSNFRIAAVDSNLEEFRKEKDEEYNQLIPEEKKALLGWGSWAGKGVPSKKPQISEEEKLQKKIAQIELLKKKRADGKQDNVIIKEHRNKQVVNYLVSKLPFPFNNKDQFNFLNNTPIGPEVNNITNHVKLIRPKIITKKGEVINPINLEEKKYQRK